MFARFHKGNTLSKLSSLTIIKKLAIVGIAGLFIAACANTMEGVGKDLQTMGNSMGGSKNTNTSNQSQTQGKDVVVTPVK
jgi:predicted small secreted protein